MTADSDLLAMTWPSEGAARQFLKRRGTTARALGCVISAAQPSGVKLTRKAPPKRIRKPREPIVAETEPMPAPTLETAVPHPGWAQQPFRLDDGGYEGWAIEVDDLLGAAGEEAEREGDLQALFRARAEPADAFNFIVERRAAELFGGDRVPSFEEWRASNLQKMQSAEPSAPETADLETAANPQLQMPQELPEAASEEKNLLIAAGDSISAAISPAISPTEAARQFFLRLAEPVDQQTAETVGPRLAKQVGAELLLIDQRTGTVATRFLPQAPRSNRLRPQADSTRDPWPRVVPLLEREGGATAAMLKTALGWKQAPARTLLRQWAADAGRELLEATVAGSRCYSLAKPSRR